MARVRGLRATDQADYLIRYEDVGIDDYPDTPDEAPAIRPGNTFSGAVQYPGDLDLVWLDVSAATAVRIDTGLPVSDGGSPDLVVEVHHADGGLGRAFVYERTVLRLPADESLLISAFGRNRVDVGAFEVTTAELGVDDHSDDPAFATPIQPSTGQQASASFERTGDVDAVSFKQIAGHLYQAKCSSTSYGSCVATARTFSGVICQDPLGGYSDAPVWKAAATEGVNVVFALSGFVATYPQPYTWLLEDLGFDDHPDPPAAGTPISVGTPATGRLELSNDEDAFAFTAVAGHIMSATASAPGLSLSVEIQTLSGQPLGQGTNTTAALVPATGTYRAVVSRQYSYSSGLVPYSLVVSELGVDDYPNQATGAPPIAVGTPVTGTLEYAADSDWVSLPVTANEVYQVACTFGTSGCSLQVMDASGQTLAYGGYSQVPVRFFAAQGGTVYISVQPQYGNTGAYTLTVTELGPEDHGDTMATATPYSTLGTPMTGALLFSGDVDMFSFSATAGRIYDLACSAGAASCQVQLLTASGTQLASGYGQTTTRGLAPTTGTLYARVSASSSGSVSYTLTVTDIGTDDHANTAAGATSVTVGTPVTGAIQYQGDVDVLVLTTVPSQLYRVECTAAVGRCAVAVRSGTTSLGSAYESTLARVAFKAPSTSVTIELSASLTSSWSVLVTDLGVDDHGDTAVTGTPLTLGAAAIAGAIEVPADKGVFTLASVAVNDIVVVTCVPVSGVCQLRVVDPLGGLVLSDASQSGQRVVGFKAALPGTYSVEVTTSTYSGMSAYTISAATGSDDYGDTLATATALTLGATITGGIDYTTDVDYFTVALPAGVQRTVTLSGVNVQARVLDPPGGWAGYVYAGSPRTLTPTAAGTYSIRVEGYYGQGGAFALTVQ